MAFGGTQQIIDEGFGPARVILSATAQIVASALSTDDGHPARVQQFDVLPPVPGS
jgi:hypothetical protein